MNRKEAEVIHLADQAKQAADDAIDDLDATDRNHLKDIAHALGNGPFQSRAGLVAAMILHVAIGRSAQRRHEREKGGAS